MSDDINREEFKKEYLTDSFYFINNKEDFVVLQMIGFWLGVKNHIGDFSLIAYDWHDILPKTYKKGQRVAKNLTFFPEGKFQISDFWVRGASYGEPESVDECVKAYLDLK